MLKLPNDMTQDEKQDFSEKLVSTTTKKILAFFVGMATFLLSGFWMYNDWKNQDFAYKQGVATTLQKVSNTLEIISLRQDLTQAEIEQLKQQVKELEKNKYGY